MATPTFRNYGGMYQLRLETAEDLAYIHKLEKARWSATSAPTEQFYCDPKVMKYLDTDGNGRIRVHELQAALSWLLSHLRRHERVEQMSDELVLADIDEGQPDGIRLKELAELMLERLGAEPRDRITLAQVRAFHDSYAGKFPNGDGVLPPEHAGSPELAQLVQDIVALCGGAPDLGGSQGVRAEDVTAFLDRAQRYLAWEAEGAAANVWGDATADAFLLVEELAPKIDQYFAQCDLLRLEHNAAARMHASPEVLAALDISDTETLRRWVHSAPLAPPREDGVLDLGAGARLNPVYEAPLRRLAGTVLPRVQAEAEPGAPPPGPRLTRASFAAAREQLQPYRAFITRRPADAPTALPIERLRALVGSALPTELLELLRRDQDIAEELQQWNSLEKLILYQRWLKQILNNFVSFPALFDPRQRALFIAGTLILDGRELGFCVRVRDRAAHKKIADTSAIFTVYAELTRKAGDTTQTSEIAVAVTSGTRGGIGLGKRGVFYDRDGNEWDAVVVDLIVHPISLFETITAPFRRMKDSATQRLEKFAGSRTDLAEGAANDTLIKREEALKRAAENPPKVPPAPTVPGTPPAAAKPATPSATRDLLVGGGVALLAIGSTLVFFIKTLADNIVPAALVLGGIVLTIVLFSGLLGWLKLRRRDLSTVLEACGWAMNLRMILTRRLSLLFTRRPGLPPGSIQDHQDLLAAPDAQDDEDTTHGRTVALSIGGIVVAANLLFAAFRWDDIMRIGYLGALRALLDSCVQRTLPPGA